MKKLSEMKIGEVYTSKKEVVASIDKLSLKSKKGGEIKRGEKVTLSSSKGVEVEGYSLLRVLDGDYVIH